MDSVTKVTQIVTMLDDNLKSLATKVMELEKKIEDTSPLKLTPDMEVKG